MTESQIPTRITYEYEGVAENSVADIERRFGPDAAATARSLAERIETGPGRNPRFHVVVMDDDVSVGVSADCDESEAPTEVVRMLGDNVERVW